MHLGFNTRWGDALTLWLCFVLRVVCGDMFGNLATCVFMLLISYISLWHASGYSGPAQTHTPGSGIGFMAWPGANLCQLLGLF